MPLREDLLNPIPGPNPSGEDLRYAPVYDKIKEARREDDEGPQGDWQRERKVADWPQVIKLCNESLASKSKDLQLAVWLSEALLKKEGLAQFHLSLKMVHGLLENFWDTLYPELEDGDAEYRATPLDWLGTRQDKSIREIPLVKAGYGYLKYKDARGVPTEDEANSSESKATARSTAIADGKITPEDWDKAVAATSKEFYEKIVDEFDATLESLEALSLLTEEKFGDVAPSLGPLKTSLEEVRHVANMTLQAKGGRAGAAVEEEAPVEDEVVEESTYSSSASSGGAATAAAPARKVRKATAGAEPVDAEDAAERIAICATFLRQLDAYSPAPYLLLRGLRFGELRAGGESPSYTLLEPPPTEVRQNLKRLASEYEWAQVLETAENAMALPCGRAWLDLQRYAHKAAEELGYTYIAQAIGSEVRALLTDLPELPSWTLSDDTPTANAETQTWLQQFKPAPADSAPSYSYYQEEPRPSAPAADHSQETEAPPDAYQLATQAMQSGRTQEALEILSEDLSQQQSGRGRFQRKIQIAQIFLTMGQAAIAESILEELESFIDRHHLEEWEMAEMVAHPLTLLYRCRNGEGNEEEKRKLYARICRLHPLQAFAVSSKR